MLCPNDFIIMFSYLNRTTSSKCLIQIESQMANPHRTMEIQIQLEAKGSELHLSLNYSKSKEKIWDQHQLTSNQKKIKFKTLPPFFIFWIFGHHLPRANNGLSGGGRKQHLDFHGSFLGAGDAINCHQKWDFQGGVPITCL